MAKTIQYITQLNASDISKMLDAGNLRAGKGVKVSRGPEGLELSVDKDYILEIIWQYINLGLCSSANFVTLLNAINSYKDPGVS